MNILDPQVGDTYTYGDVSIVVKSRVQDSVEYDTIGSPPKSEIDKALEMHANAWFAAHSAMYLLVTQNPNGGTFNVKDNCKI